MDSLAGRQRRPHSLSDVMHQAEAIFSHTDTLSYLSISTQSHRSAEQLNGRRSAATSRSAKSKLIPVFTLFLEQFSGLSGLAL